MAGCKYPFFSVIMPAYNEEERLQASVASVLNQTYSNFELLIIDDGSTDNTYEVAKKLAEKNSHIHIFQQKNQGQWKARNLGIYKSKGNYISFIDADDTYAVTMLEEMAKKISFGDYEIISCNYIKITKEKKTFIDAAISPLKNVAIKNIIDKGSYGIWCKIFKRDFLIKNSIYFKNLSPIEDIEFVFHAYLYAKNFNYIISPLYNYNIRFDSSSKIVNKNYINKIFLCLDSTKKLFLKNKEYSQYIPEYYGAIYKILHYSVINKIINISNITERHKILKLFRDYFENSGYHREPFVSLGKKTADKHLKFIFSKIYIEEKIAIPGTQTHHIKDIIPYSRNTLSIFKKYKYILNLNYEYFLLKYSGLFIYLYYINNNTDVNLTKIDPIKHFIKQGWKEGRKPNPFFDPIYYNNRYPDVAQANVNPLVHYIKFGWKEKRSPSYELDIYFLKYKHINKQKIDPLKYFLKYALYEIQ